MEVREDATDQDRTVLRLCSGLIPVPQGALSTGPYWKLLWGIDDLPDRAAAALVGADANKAHILKLYRTDRTFLIVWSLVHARALGFFEVVSAPGESDLDSTTGVMLEAPVGAVWRDKDPTALWFESIVGDHIILGNGIDGNLDWSGGALALLGPAATPSSPYNKARVRIPPSTCFRQHVNGSVFAAGNEDQPLRVWITDEPNEQHPIFLGINSLLTSFIDIRPHLGATRITALSVYQQYVTAHTDRSPINLYGVNNTSDGWKCDQSPSAANASAINPDCVGDAVGDASFYLGRDCEIYKDEAIRSGPFEKRSARDQEIVTTQGADIWNREMVRQLGSFGYHTVYDRNLRLFWVFARSIYTGRSMLWVYNERTRTVAGPIRYPDAILSTVLVGLELAPPQRDGIGSAGIGQSFIVE